MPFKIMYLLLVPSQQLDKVGMRMMDMGTNTSDIEVRPQRDGIRVIDSDGNAQVSCLLVDVILTNWHE